MRMSLDEVIKGLEELEGFLFKEYTNIKAEESKIYYDRFKSLSDAIALLKEREAVKPIRDKKTGRVWLCGNCGSYVGFEDHDENDPNEFDKYCRECGRPVLWEGR